MTQHYRCPEGVFYLPDNVSTQTINIITFASGQVVNVNRDTPVPGVVFEQYLQDQIRILELNCKNYEQISLLMSESIGIFSKVAMLAFSFMPTEGITCWQYIVLAERLPGHIMLFSSLFKDETSLNSGSSQVNTLFENIKAY
ncbi:hypothetical protein ED28_08220 [[Pantoea] beijingensis]|uniref:DUF1795 domain-containing protein n=1 Tax=[Pantoea] beijingensis TaxID=1324864 RepID=A0A443IE59_9GAMM|nr:MULTISPECIES: DcrB-related protein [Erwiniaceae]RWR02356.1 hypothetical protein ED28_08220 [[Pantoea] beijingensis]